MKEIIKRALMQTVKYKDDRRRWVAEAQKRTGRWAFTTRQVEFVIWAVKHDRNDKSGY